MTLRRFSMPVLLLAMAPGSLAAPDPWPAIKVAVDFDCARPDQFPSPTLAAAVREAEGPLRNEGVKVWGDRAYSFDLNGDSHPDYLVPLSCGATGNCTWGLFAIGPVRLLGRIDGARIYLHELRGPWTLISAFESTGAGSGRASRYLYAMEQGRYLVLESRDLQGDEVDRFLQRGGEPPCSRAGRTL